MALLPSSTAGKEAFRAASSRGQCAALCSSGGVLGGRLRRAVASPFRARCSADPGMCMRHVRHSQPVRAGSDGGVDHYAVLMLAASPMDYNSASPADTGGLNYVPPAPDQRPCATCTSFAVVAAAGGWRRSLAAVAQQGGCALGVGGRTGPPGASSLPETRRARSPPRPRPTRALRGGRCDRIQG